MVTHRRERPSVRRLRMTGDPSGLSTMASALCEGVPEDPASPSGITGYSTVNTSGFADTSNQRGLLFSFSYRSGSGICESARRAPWSFFHDANESPAGGEWG